MTRGIPPLENASHWRRYSRFNGRLTSPARRPAPAFPIHHSSFIIHHSSRPAFTLIELLIVVAILVVLAAFLIPAIKPALEDRKIREAARMLNVFLTGAQARAIERGRPVGVWLERNPNSPNECIQLFMAETPLPYSGDILGVRATVFMVVDNMGNPLPNPMTGQIPYYRAAFGDGLSPSVVRLIRRGDTIKFDYKGPDFLITAVNPPVGPNPASVDFDFNNNRAPLLGFVRYQIFRQPSKNGASTFALPSNTSINLYLSGAGAIGFGSTVAPVHGGGAASSPTDTSPILITFSPSGRLDRVYAQGIIAPATESLYLFVNRNDKTLADKSPNITDHVPGASDDQPIVSSPTNLDDTSNLWVTIGHRTGSVITVENANTQALAPTNLAEWQTKIAQARRFAREKTAIGGR